jgi:arabinogalactan oligomer/maltooligosaccharide transport system substrate-binding protein
MDPEERVRFEANLAAFRQTHPDVEIQHTPYETEQLRTQFQTAAAGGGGPDLVFGPSDQVGPLSLLKTIQPLDQALPAGFFDRYVPSSLDTLDGHIYAAPDQVGNHLVLCFNRALVPQAPTTAEEFVALAKKLTRGDVYGFAMNLTEPYWLVPFLGGYGGWIMDAQARPTLDTPAMVQALTFLKGLRDLRVLPQECDYQIAETLFKEGKAAMIVNGPWSWSGYRKAGVDLGIAPLFRMPGGRWAEPMVASKGYSISVNVPREKLPLVTELVAFLTSPEAELRSVRELGILPSNKAAYGDSSLVQDPYLKVSLEAIARGRRMPVVPEMRVIWDAMRPEMQNVMNGIKTPAEGARAMQKAAVEQIAAMKK